MHPLEKLPPGVVQRLTKPVRPTQLLHTIWAVTGNGNGSGNGKQGGAASAPTQPGSITSLDIRRIRGARILLVDDNELNQQVGRELLEAAGLKADVAVNGQDALDRLAESTYDLVLMDMQMPVMDGLTATRRIRENANWARLPVLAMTANTMRGDRERCLSAGMNSHIAKPIEPDDFFGQLLRWLPEEGFGPNATKTADADVSVPPVPAASQSEAEPGDAARQPLDAPLAARTPEDQEAVTARLLRIPELDAAAGQRRVLNRPDIYESLLRKFIVGQRSVVERTRMMLREGHLMEAERAIHTLKSTAATIGADALASLAASTELALREENSLPAQTLEETLLQPLDTELQQMVAALARALPPLGQVAHSAANDVGRYPANADDVTYQRAITRLEMLLSEDDAEALEMFTEATPLLRKRLGSRYEEMARHLQAYRLSDALAALRSAVVNH